MNPVTISMDNFDVVFTQYERYIKAIADKYTVRGYDFDDLVSIGYETLYQCVNHFKEDYNIPFKGYLARALNRNYRYLLYNEMSNNKRRLLTESVWLDQPTDTGDRIGDLIPVNDSPIDVMSLLDDYFKFLGTLNENKQKIYYYSVFTELEQKEIGELLGLKRANVSFHLKKLQKQFRETHNREDYYK